MTTSLEYRVYLHCHPIFSGATAKKRKLKQVNKLIDKHEGSLKPLLTDMKKGKLASVLKKLLTSGVFESQARARAVFPEAFNSSPSHAAKREAIEDEAVLADTRKLEELISDDENEIKLSSLSRETTAEDPSATSPITGTLLAPRTIETRSKVDEVESVSLFPAYLPYSAQHVILTMTQKSLEDCCFDFAKSFAPFLLLERQWECSDAVELTQWTKLFKKNKNTGHFPVDFESAEAALAIKEVTVLRHTAVHRLPTTAKRVTHLVQAAVTMARLMNDEKCTTQLQHLELELSSKVEALDLNKDRMERKFLSKMEIIQEERKRLDQEERTLLQNLTKSEAENQLLIGQLLNDSVPRIFASTHLAQESSDDKPADDIIESEDENENEPESKGDEYQEADCNTKPESKHKIEPETKAGEDDIDVDTLEAPEGEEGEDAEAEETDTERDSISKSQQQNSWISNIRNKTYRLFGAFMLE